MELQTYLQRLIGKTVTNTVITTSTVIARKIDKDDPDNIKTELTFQLYIDDYTLNIYNPITILPSEKDFADVKGLKIVAVEESDEKAELIFDNSYNLIVDMRDEAYDGPEALYLTGPNHFWVAW
ncbi:hypothetical protein F0919_01935 [Taibaiella lutea]|uniref:Uncharacterized protein n=1 Tax=Taibaiella lutea TaxID=2608001 RepID=A0A5M6CPY2_9BACT|nr:hypothetical protein [Taibaiella lutea]KAA5536450.1 hypothetical protein F0919_01935 [Taibaiella lutea]